MIEYTTRIFWSDLTFEAQEKIKSEVMERLRLDKEFMIDIDKLVDEIMTEDEEDKSDTKLIEWKKYSLLEAKADKIIADMYGEISI